MAQRVQVMLIDDVDGGDGAETVTFSLDGVSYEIDLSEKNASTLREAFSPWVGHARRVSGRTPAPSRASSSSNGRSTGSRRSASGIDTGAVRAWARSNGHEVSERGRISAKVLEAYNAAH